MKNTILLFLFAITTIFAANTVQAQCPVIDCQGDVTLYLTDNSCAVEYTFELPAVTDFCHSSTSFTYTGETQLWIVPEGVEEIMVKGWGASGGHGSGPGYELNMGGKGAMASGIVSVSPGDMVYVNVGGKGENAQIADVAQGGWNGGGIGGLDTDYTGNGAGGGGGATDFRIGGNNLEHRIVVAAGGGGASKNAPGGAGGDANGLDGNSVYTGAPGLGASLIAGGIAHFTERGATSGELGLGGNGSSNHSSWGGGGGGAGYYGGSGGTATEDHNDGHAGSGGGGSSYVGTAADATVLADQRIGNGLAAIYYSNPEPETAAQVEGPVSGSLFPVGTTTLTFSAPGVFETAYCYVQVHVLDTIAPVAITQNIDVYLEEEASVVITPEEIDNGSVDNCSIASMSLDVDTFTGDQTGENTVTLTVEDESGNLSTAMAIVNVIRPPQEFVETYFVEKGDDKGTSSPAFRNMAEEAEADNVPNAAMTIFPNPTSDRSVEVKLELPEMWEHVNLQVFSANGQRVLRQFVPLIMPTDRIRLPVAGLDSGVYLVQLSTENQSLTQRLVIR